MRAVGEVIPAAQLHTEREAILSPHRPADTCAEEAYEVFLITLVTTGRETIAVWDEAGRRAAKHLVMHLAYTKSRNLLCSIWEKNYT